MIYLKNFQQKVVQEFDSFCTTAVKKRNDIQEAVNHPGLPDSVRETIRNTDWIKDTFDTHNIPFVDSCKNGLGERYPRLVIKVPTGGGKTLLGVEAIRIYQTKYAEKRTGLVVWIVPTETIYSQTIKKLRDKGHFLRQLLDQVSGNRTMILEKGQRVSATDIETNLVILFVMIQSISRRTNKEALKVFQDAGGYEGFFPQDNRNDLHAKLLKSYPNLDSIADASSFFPLIKTSLGNVIRVSEPFIIIDEIHKVFSDMARKTIDNLNPKMIMGMSATPKREMNILIKITGLELKEEEMIKLDMHIIPPNDPTVNDWQAMVREIKIKRDSLEEDAIHYRQVTGTYIRPIALIQVEATGKDQRGRGRVHSMDVKEFIQTLNINPDEIAIKTSAQNDIEDVDLFLPDCPIRYLITKEALREGWDCSFAYILGVIPNVNSNTGITQLIGRILRQPNAKKTGIHSLDESYVFYSRGHTGPMVERVEHGFSKEGLDDLTSKIQIEGNPQVNPTKTVKVRDEFLGQYGNSLYLPVWLMVEESDKLRRFSYANDVKPRLEFSQFLLSDNDILGIQESLSGQKRDKLEYIFTLSDENSGVMNSVHAIEPLEPLVFSLSYLTRRYADVIDNPFLARVCAQTHWDQLKVQLNQEDIENNVNFIISSLVKIMQKEKNRQEEFVFKKLIDDNKLIMAVTDDPDLGFTVPYTEVINVGREPNTFRYYLFDDVEISAMNSLEKEIGTLLDSQEKIIWWFRNKVNRQWYSIQGWKKNRIRPDFVAAKKTENGKLHITYVLEAKGEHLLGNADTQYKKMVLELMTRINKSDGIKGYQQSSLLPPESIHDKIEFYLVEQDDEERAIRNLFN